jgi:hypothetical protein
LTDAAEDEAVNLEADPTTRASNNTDWIFAVTGVGILVMLVLIFLMSITLKLLTAYQNRFELPSPSSEPM